MIKSCFPCGHDYRAYAPSNPDNNDDPLLKASGNGLFPASPSQEIWPKSAPQFWDMLLAGNPADISEFSGARLAADDTFLLPCLNDTWLIDMKTKKIKKVKGEFITIWDQQLPFLILVYLVTATREPLSGEMIAPRDLFTGQDLFRGPYELETKGLIKKFGQDRSSFLRAADKLSCKELDAADVSIRIQIFPKFVIDYLVWLGDEEFPASITILLDSKLMLYYPPDAISVVVNLVSDRLLVS